VRRLRNETSFSRRRQSQTLTVSSLEALTKKAPLPATDSWFTARRCSARCATYEKGIQHMFYPKHERGAGLRAYNNACYSTASVWSVCCMKLQWC